MIIELVLFITFLVLWQAVSHWTFDGIQTKYQFISTAGTFDSIQKVCLPLVTNKQLTNGSSKHVTRLILEI